MRNPRRSRSMAFLALLGGLGLAFITLATTAATAADGRMNRLQVTLTQVIATATVSASPTAVPSPTPTPVAAVYMPWMSVFKTPPVELLKALTSDLSGGKLQAFSPGEAIIYHAGGLNNLGTPVQVGLRWDLEGACNAGVLYNSTLSIPPIWETAHYATAPTCLGVYTATARLSYEDLNLSRITRYAVNPQGSIQINVQHGFDKCYYPDLDDMEIWWLSSPYVVYNLYIGGISFACDDQPLNAVWVHQAAQEGWQFILTWVGPQAPCSKFKYKFSSDPDEAYVQGREEAASAHSTAEGLGFFGPKVIYYDLESYSGASSECREAAKSFLKGWTEKLHDLGDKSGAYGAPCTSYISDWATVNPPPDDVWIAHWYLDRYDPDATVWDTPCLSDSLWPGYRRLKQYTGGHKETWGGVGLTIDSNVLNGEITVLPLSAAAASLDAPVGVVLQQESPPLRDLGLFASGEGWLIEGERLLTTLDSEGSWQEVTPQMVGGEESSLSKRLLGAAFYDRQHGWAALSSGAGLTVAYTRDGGESWLASRLEAAAHPEEPGIAAAYFEPLDENRAYLALKLQSGSSFSLGRLFYLQASSGEGIHWEERSLPLGEAVAFTDELNGWTAGGADGKQAYFTTDGGLSWTETRTFAHSQYLERQGIPVEASNLLQGELPEGALAADMTVSGYGWAVVQRGECLGEKRPGERVTCTQRWELLATEDGGKSWVELEVEPDPGG